MCGDIKEQFDKVIAFSQGIQEPKTEELFEKWYTAKRNYINAFGGKLIYEYPEEVVFELDEAMKKYKLNCFIDSVHYTYHNHELADFINVHRSGFFNNRLDDDYDSEDTHISKGTKFIKAFKYFEKDKTALSHIQDEASRIIQENKMRGKICLSVHPLDYLSISENPYNWNSCHSLDGDYRMGNLNYMCDNSTVVCYLKGSDGCRLPLFPSDVPWNGKKWRVLLFFSTDGNMVFAGRQYPFDSTSALDFVVNNLIPKSGLIDDYFEFSCWHNDYITSMKLSDKDCYLNGMYLPVNHNLIRIRDLVGNTPNTFQFNDLIESSSYTMPFYSFKRRKEWNHWDTADCGFTNRSTHFNIGEPVKCLRCGSDERLTASRLQCIDCDVVYGIEDSDDYVYCACCDSRIYIEDAVPMDEEYICQYCADTHTVVCEHCGTLNMRYNIVYDKDNDRYLCRWCDDDIKHGMGELY